MLKLWILVLAAGVVRYRIYIYSCSVQSRIKLRNSLKKKKNFRWMPEVSRKQVGERERGSLRGGDGTAHLLPSSKEMNPLSLPLSLGLVKSDAEPQAAALIKIHPPEFFAERLAEAAIPEQMGRKVTAR